MALRVQVMRHCLEAEARQLLCFLLVWHGPVPADPDGRIMLRLRPMLPLYQKKRHHKEATDSNHGGLIAGNTPDHDFS